MGVKHSPIHTPLKTKCSVNQYFTEYSAERQGFEPWQRFPVDRLAICSITTLAPLLRGVSKSKLSV